MGHLPGHGGPLREACGLAARTLGMGVPLLVSNREKTQCRNQWCRPPPHEEAPQLQACWVP